MDNHDMTNDAVESADLEKLVAMEADIQKRKAKLLEAEAIALALTFEEMAKKLGMTARAVLATTRKPRRKRLVNAEEFEIETEVEGEGRGVVEDAEDPA